MQVVANRRAIHSGLDFAGHGSYLTAPAGKPENSGFFGGVAQLVRAPACHAGGRGFESRRSRHFWHWEISHLASPWLGLIRLLARHDSTLRAAPRMRPRVPRRRG